MSGHNVVSHRDLILGPFFLFLRLRINIYSALRIKKQNVIQEIFDFNLFVKWLRREDESDLVEEEESGDDRDKRFAQSECQVNGSHLSKD